MTLLDIIREKAKLNQRHIVLPEGTSERTLRAAEIIIQEKLARLTLLGNVDEIRKREKSFHLNLSDVQIIEPRKSPKFDLYAETFYNLRKGRGVTKDDAVKTISQDIYYGPMMIYMGDADGEVSGAEHTTADTVRPALQIVKTAPGISVVSGAMVMLTKKTTLGHNGIFIFSDVAITANPTAMQLAEIAICSANTAKSVAGIENPKVAMLSFSTKGSAEHELVTKVIEATRIAREMSPDLQIDGELQADASLIASIGLKKSPGSTVAGHANVLIFPDLQSGNIAYKLVERLGDAEAIGPILQGLGAPINDLSRGCSVEDIVNLVAITVNQCTP